MEENQNITLGIKLKEERERLGFHLENISRETRISLSILKNLEDENLNDLPQKIYVVGFVKTYAKILKLSESECLSLLDNLYGVSSSNYLREDTSNVILDGQKESKNYLRTVGLIIPVIIVSALILYIVKPKKINTNNTTNQIIESEQTSLSTQLIEKKEPKQEPSTVEEKKKTSEVIPKQKEVAKKVEEIKIAKIEVAKSVENKEDQADTKKEEKEIRFYSFPKVLYKFSQKNIEQELASIPPKYLKATIEGKQNVFMTAIKGTSWLTYQIDDGPIYKFILKEGKDLFLQADLLKLFVGNINATKIFLNNRLLEITSKSGVKSLVFPQEDASEFKIPLFIFKKDGKVQSSKDYLEKKEKN